MKVMNIVGARPNFVKAAPLLAEMRKQPGFRPILVHTGQHYDPEMSDFFFRDLDIPRPDINLGVGPGSHAGQTAEIMRRLEPVMIEEAPDIVLVVGDVNSTLAGALTAGKQGIPVAHVEAGLRSFDRSMPEEINRVVTDAVADLFFATEPSGVENLLKEGRPRSHIFLVGNVMIDTLKRFLGVARRTPAWADWGLSKGDGSGEHKRYAVLTLHRPGTVDDPKAFRKVWEPLQEIASQIPIIFPVHPRTQQRLKEAGFKNPSTRAANASRGIRMIPPLGYLEFLRLQQQASLVITDSGGIQEETTVLGVPCLTVRENTERPITVSEGTNTVVGLDPERIREEARRVLSGKGKHGRLPRLWDGHAAERIVKILHDFLESGLGRRRSPRGNAVAATRSPRQILGARRSAHTRGSAPTRRTE